MDVGDFEGCHVEIGAFWIDRHSAMMHRQTHIKLINLFDDM